MLEYTSMPYGSGQPWNPWSGAGRSMFPGGGWGGINPGWGRGLGFPGGCFPGGPDFGMGRGMGNDFGMDWSRGAGPGQPESVFTMNLSAADLLGHLSWIPSALREAAGNVESPDAMRRLQTEGAVRGIFGYLKGTLSAFGVDASIDAGIERRGFSVSVTYSRSALLSVADAIERVINDAGSRGFSGGCTISIGRGFAAIVRGIGVSCGGSWDF